MPMSKLTRTLATLLPSAMLPWSRTASLQALVYADIYGTDDSELVTRDIAMRVAPIKRARAVIVGRLGDLPLELGQFVGGEFVADAKQPAWLTQTAEVATTPWYRFARSLDDVLFYGWSLWAVERDALGQIIDADRIDAERWKFDQSSPTGVAIALGDLAAPIWGPISDASSVLLFAGPDEGLLTNARDTIIGWRHMERAWVGRVRNPIPMVVLHEKSENSVSQTEAQQYVGAWAKARTAPNGAVGFLPAQLDLEVHGDVNADLFNEGRNAARIDVANHTNLPVSYLDGSTASSSLTYVTQEGSRAQIIDDLEYWIAPFEARLSEPDVTGDARKVVRLNRSNLSAVPNDDHGPERDTPNTEQSAQAGTSSSPAGMSNLRNQEATA